VITWFAGIFYLPRLFVYHADAEDVAGRERFKIMERKLYRGIMMPSGILTILLGIALVSIQPVWMQQGWLHAKLAFVLALVGYHIWCGRLVKAFAQDANRHSALWYRLFNEAPVVGLIAIVILVIVKPF